MQTIPHNAAPAKPGTSGWYDLFFILILIAGAYLRFTGLDWDEGTYLHPDERFLAMVESSIQPVGSFRDYFDTQVSTLNPNNKGHGFFVYGTLPIFFIRYVMEWAGQAGYGETAVWGRPLAGAFDLLTIFVLYLLASRLYDKRVGVLAAAFSAFAVLQIQLSHFFTVDIFANLFIWLALYAGVIIAQAKPAAQNAIRNPQYVSTDPPRPQPSLPAHYLSRFTAHPLFRPSLLFGIISGAALASKVSAYPVVLILPLAAGVWYSRVPEREKSAQGVIVLCLLAAAGLLFALTFRIFQPYAFSGPGFFGLIPNPNFVDNLKSLRNLVQPSSGFPPSVQWFDRPFWFSGQHLTLWGLGLPLGLAAWAGVIGMGWRIFRGEWRAHLVIWAWVVGHFLWQSTVPNPTMRYQLPIYPGMALMAGWMFVAWWDGAENRKLKFENRKPILDFQSSIKAFALFGGAVVLVLTALYAFTFSRIYTREITRIAASRWMYQNIPAAINLPVATADGALNQALPFPSGFFIRQGEPYATQFPARYTGTLDEITLGYAAPQSPADSPAAFYLSVSASPDGSSPLGTALLPAAVGGDVPPGEIIYTFGFDEPLPLLALQPYYITLELVAPGGEAALCDPFSISLFGVDGGSEIVVQPPDPCAFRPGEPWRASFAPEGDAALSEVVIAQPLGYRPVSAPQTLRVELSSQPDFAQLLASGSAVIEGETAGVTFPLDQPVSLAAQTTYYLRLSLESNGQVSVHGSVLAQESSWDDPLPMRVDGYDGFGGVYQGDNNLELYWDDNAEKRERILTVLDNVDVIAISSDRQWGSLTRLPERWPLVDAYYRALLGCPADRTVEWCYIVAEPGMFRGTLGFELVETFTSSPTLFGYSLNDQYSEEAFTVYDHPKVFIFVKTDAYNAAAARAYFEGQPLYGGEVPAEASPAPAAAIKPLLLSEEAAARLETSGTWGALFDRDSLLNRFQVLGVLVWYAAVSLTGLAAYPLLRLVFPGLPDKGYPLARTAGLLSVSYMVWLTGSAGIPLARWVLTLIISLYALLGLGLGLRQREGLRQEWQSRRRYFLIVECLALAAFLFFLAIRFGNPDLWHPWKGGEKPMDFAYFNAVLRSDTFPPYDPWFAGGYINYYYYGFVLAGVLVKWLGIVPAVGYNLVIPTFFSLTALGAFSLGWNLLFAARGEQFAAQTPLLRERLHYVAGLAAAAAVVVMGNLGTFKMVYQGYQRIAAPPGTLLEEAFFLSRWVWGLRGFFQTISSSAELPYGIADWYWLPSRAIPAPGDVEPITEFPFFTFTYGDLHAHMLALPLTLLALTWALAVVLGKARWRSLWDGALAFLFGGLVFGVLRPTNTWDYPTYLALGVVALIYAVWRNHQPQAGSLFASAPRWAGAGITALSAVVWLGALSWFLFQPYTHWYALGYADVNVWNGGQTPLGAFLVHWAIFLLPIISWMLWETRAWLAATPASTGLRALRRLREWIVSGLIILLALAAGLTYFYEIKIAWFVLPLAAWAAVLLLRPAMPDPKRAVLFLIGTGLFLTLLVETIVLTGDIGRMNTVFKFYLQVWIIFGVAAAASLGWLIPAVGAWQPWAARSWRAAFGVLVFLGAMYPLTAGLAKIKDRMAEHAPAALDGMAYMEYAITFDQDRQLTLAEDYRAILWMQENVTGTPVIVEAQVVEYHWGSRFSIYTGLPAVLGWNWHQRQQRTGHDGDVWRRDGQIEEFYTTTNINTANNFIAQYGVRYIIVGQLERAYHNGPGLEKFETYDGMFWREVYRDGETVIYEVMRDE